MAIRTDNTNTCGIGDSPLKRISLTRRKEEVNLTFTLVRSSVKQQQQQQQQQTQQQKTTTTKQASNNCLGVLFMS